MEKVDFEKTKVKGEVKQTYPIGAFHMLIRFVEGFVQGKVEAVKYT